MTHNAFVLSVVRHGETYANRERIVQGQLVFEKARLTEEGLTQARRIGRRLADERFTLMLSSDLERARQTAEHIAAHHTTPSLELDERVRERNFGVFQGRPAADFVAIKRGEHAAEYTPEGGESRTDVDRRASRFLQSLATRVLAAGREEGAGVEEPHVLVVSHGGFIRSMMRHMKIALDGTPANTSLLRVRVVCPRGTDKGMVAEALIVNCTRHFDEHASDVEEGDL